MIKIILIPVFLLVTLSAWAGEELDLNREGLAKESFLSLPSVQRELNEISKLETKDYKINFLYFVSFQNRFPMGIPPGNYIANEHVMMFKSSDNKTSCEVRANIVWQVSGNSYTIYEDYSEPARPFRCY